MADYTSYLPRFKPGAAITCQLTADVSGGNLVEITGDYSVAPAAAGSTKVLGVVSMDGKVGDSVTVFREGVQRIVADGAIPAGAKVQAAANGRIVAGTTAPIGTAIQAATAAGQVIDVVWA